jgi:hypothetical protein
MSAVGVVTTESLRVTEEKREGHVATKPPNNREEKL